jgi:ketosteroid isomerase-like protein
MSEENVELVRRAGENFNAFMRGELSSEAFAETLDPQIEVHWRDRRTYPDTPQHLRGVQDLIRFSEQYRATWADVVVEQVEIINAPEDRVLITVHQSSRGRESGVPMAIHFFEVDTLRDGRVRRIDYFRHRADALEAAGLRE